MDEAAKAELAMAIRAASEVHEASYMGSGSYRKSYSEAVAEAVADADLRPIVSAMLISGYCDFHEWADSILPKT